MSYTESQAMDRVSLYADYLNLFLLITTIVGLNLFYESIKSLILGTKCVFKHQDSASFHSLEVVDRGSESTQLQVTENVN